LLREAINPGTREGTMHAPLPSHDDDGRVSDCVPALPKVSLPKVSRNPFGICVVGTNGQAVMAATLAAAEATR
jgi:glutaminase